MRLRSRELLVQALEAAGLDEHELAHLAGLHKRIETVGVRELRQNASALLDRVASGVTIRITNHGHPVAELVPLTERRRTRADLIASGDLQPGRGSVLDLEPIQAPPGTPSTDELLAELRDER